jgi:hypothetical protein
MAREFVFVGGWQCPLTTSIGPKLFRRAGLAKTGDAIAVLPLMTGLQERDAFETLENVSLGSRGADGA